MATNVKQFIGAGFAMAQWARTSGPYPYGTTGSLSQGTGAELARLYGVKTADISIPEPDVVTITGDDGPLGIFTFPPTDLPSFVLEVGQVDYTIASATQNTNIYTIGNYYDIQLQQPNDPQFNDVMLVFTSQAKSKESGSDGESGWHHLIAPKAQMSYLGTAFNERGEQTFRYQVVINKFSRYPWGQQLNVNAEGTTSAALFEWFTERRVTFFTRIQSGAGGSIVLERTPSAANRVMAWRDGVNFIPSVNVSTRTITLSGGAAGNVVSGFYEYV